MPQLLAAPPAAPTVARARLRPRVAAAALATAAAALLASPARAQSAADVQYWNASWAAYQALQAIPLAQRGYVSTTVQLPIVIQAKRPAVYDAYANVYNALGLQPFLTGIRPVRCSDGRFDFIALENIPFPDGSIFPAQTVARQRFDRPRGYKVDTYDAYSLGATSIAVVTHQSIDFQNLPGGSTRVVETLTFEAPPAFIDLATQGGYYAHLTTQKALKAGIEAGSIKSVPFPRNVPIRCGEDDEDDDR